MDINIVKIPEMPGAANCYIVFSENSKKGVLVDPGSASEVILKNLEENNVEIVKIILTHGHADHIASIKEMKDKLDVPVLVHQGDAKMLEDGFENFSSLMFKEAVEIQADKIIKHGDILKIEDGFEIEVIHTPGHTQGGVCLKLGNVIITGDTIFANSIGRTDFPGGNFEQIISSIKERILVYPDDIILLPGHGPESTVGNEKKNNPFIK